MSTYEDTITQFLREYWDQRSQELALALGIRDFEDVDLGRTPLAAKLALIASAASGECDRTDSDYIGDSCQSVLETLFAIPGCASYTIPAEFWGTPIGQIVALAFVWLEGDELITISEAARISGRSIQTISSRVQRGTLRGYTDPHVPNPRRSGRLVRRSDVVPAGV